MQNKWNGGCDRGFVPVNGNWDFNMDGSCGCQQANAGSRNCRSVCESADDCIRNQADCQCERSGDARRVVSCDQNTYIRRDGCETEAYACGECQNRTGCTGNADCQCETCVRNRRSDRQQYDCSAHQNRTGCTGNADCQCETCVRNRRSDRQQYDCSTRQNRAGCTGNADCQCETCVCNRRRSDCDTCRDDNAYARTRSADCACGKENGHTSAYAGVHKNRRVGMVNVEMQEIEDIFESESALRAGTLFPELHKPMNGYCPCDENCGTCKQAAAFAAWEMRLYLNTHPNDKEALALFRKLCREAGDENYATSFLTDECCANGWNWPRNPWPWEYDCRCGD